MAILNLLGYLSIDVQFYFIIYIRIAIVIFILPAIGSQFLSSVILKNVIILMIIMVIWPLVYKDYSSEINLIVIIAKEILIGIILALSLSIPFWIVEAFGEFLDNQRGASMSENIDPVNGHQVSILSGFFNFTFSAMFYACHGIILLITSLIQSYQLFPIGSKWPAFNPYLIGEIISIIMRNSIIIAGPVLITLMLSEILLGVFAKYCSQLNPFSLSMSVKSVIAIIIFYIYGFHAMSEKALPLFSINLFHHITS